ncbi:MULTISPECIES: hypothetical protein [Chromohalobacter]|uniref:hypothetical protein n=1 Tax=Chromohalobacter TaxID=42054 RepID=UPI001060DF54|nr:MULTISPECIES: hypothetical protein [Chromohalobacter]MCI0510951.1 hypothetical protein [Chromohalobacter sp.]MCI0562087.1 hypothetical protein [Nitrososphaera sp.]
MTGRKLLIEAEQLILKTLDETYPLEITLDDRDMGFYRRNDISEEADRYRVALSDAFYYLKEKGLVQYTSADHQIPRHGLKLTPAGALRAKNPIEAFKDDGVKAAIGAVVNSLARAIEKKFGA